MDPPLISIVIPVLRDAEHLEEVLVSLADPPGAEVIVVDGAPETAAMGRLRARWSGVRWARSRPGRSLQMNCGAALARGRWLLFLHADARLGPGWHEELRRAQAEGAGWGSFRLTIDSPARAARVIEWGVAQRVRWLRLPYGDQALHVRRDLFDQIGGYAPIELMEDVDLVRRLRRTGAMRQSARPVRVSARRWERDGWWRRTLENLLLVLLFAAGVPPVRLARIYYGNTGRGSESSWSGRLRRRTGRAHQKDADCGNSGRTEEELPSGCVRDLR